LANRGPGKGAMGPWKVILTNFSGSWPKKKSAVGKKREESRGECGEREKNHNGG